MKQGYRRRRGPRLLAIGGLAFAVFLLVNFLRAVKEDRVLADEIRRKEAEAAAIEQKNAELITQKQQLESEEYLEREARTKLGYRKEGESVLVIERGAADSGHIAAGTGQRTSNPILWWRYFFGQHP